MFWNYQIMYFFQGGIVSKALEPILDNNYLCGAIAKAGKDDTGELESFHSNHNRNCPKMIPFSMEGMISRYTLLYILLKFYLVNHRTLLVKTLVDLHRFKPLSYKLLPLDFTLQVWFLL